MTRIAAVDLGSNSFRMEICHTEKDVLVSDGYWKEGIRIASGIDADGNLTPEIQQAALATLYRFGQRLLDIDPQNIRCVATQTLRVAKNSAQFLPLAEEALGQPIEVIAGREEARLVFSGCSHSLPDTNEKRLIIDIGGASTELAIGRGLIAKRCECFHVGCVNTTLEFFPDGIITEEGMQAAELHARAEFEEVLKEFHCRNWDKAFGSAGTVGSLADIGQCSGLTAGVVTPALIKHIRAQFIAAGHVDNLRGIPGLKEDRREVLVGGLAVLSAVFTTFNIREMRPALGALRMGILYDLLDRRTFHDVRDRTVSALLKRGDCDKAQAARVAAIADIIWQRLAGQEQSENRKLLQWTSTLHEIGKSVSPSHYHHHSSYLLRHSDMPGFSRINQETMAELVYALRGRLLDTPRLYPVCDFTRMVFALRLAVIVAHARENITLPHCVFSDTKDSLSVSVPKDWIEQHPLTYYLVCQEKIVWAEVGIRFNLHVRPAEEVSP